jgi:hypothetical protein
MQCLDVSLQFGPNLRHRACDHGRGLGRSLHLRVTDQLREGRSEDLGNVLAGKRGGRGGGSRAVVGSREVLLRIVVRNDNKTVLVDGCLWRQKRTALAPTVGFILRTIDEERQ